MLKGFVRCSNCGVDVINPNNKGLKAFVERHSRCHDEYDFTEKATNIVSDRYGLMDQHIADYHTTPKEAEQKKRNWPSGEPIPAGWEIQPGTTIRIKQTSIKRPCLCKDLPFGLELA